MTAMAAAAAVHSFPSGRVQRVNLRAQLLWTARFRVLWVVGVFALVTLIAMVRIFSLAFTGQLPERTSLQEALLPTRC
ncbi:MAG: penicillin-binding protein 2, partial [Erythrobacteraceae bacterium]